MIYIVGSPDMAAADLPAVVLPGDATSDIIRASDRARRMARNTGEPHSVFKLVEVATFTGHSNKDNG